MQTIRLPRIEVDNSILLSLKSTAEELSSKMKFYTAVALYQKKRLSLGKAAQFAGMDRVDFIKALKDENLPIFDYRAPLKTRLPRFARNDKLPSLRGFEEAVAVSR